MKLAFTTTIVLLTINFDAVFRFTEGLFLIYQRARERLSEHELSFSLPCLGNIPLSVHLLVHHVLVVLKIAAETFSFQSCPY
jgi:hypothetical protein